MQKSILLLASLCTIIVLAIGLSSCKDDEPFVKPNLSVASATHTVGEAAGTLQVEVTLDKGAPEDITIEYDLGGTAISPADYSIVGTEGEVDIAKGATSGVIQLQIVSDALYEGNETIEISLQDVSSDDVIITNNDEAVVTITDDDTQLEVSFAVTALTVNEADALFEVEVTLDQAAPQDVIVQYELTGTAADSITANADEVAADYSIWGGGSGEVEIASGQTTGTIRIRVRSDYYLEDGISETAGFDPETIIISLTEASGGVQISTDNAEMEIKVVQENGKVIALFWDDDTTIDMDLFLWIGDDISSLDNLVAGSFFASTQSPEFVFIPAVATGVAYGVSYVYYEGNVTPMDFESQFIDYADGVLEGLATRDVFAGSYTLANINAWDSFDDLVNIEQTFEIEDDGDYVNITAITTPTTGSRVKTYKLPPGTQKTKSSPLHLKKRF